VRGVNLKLMKLGGILPALRICQRGRELGMKVMLGCMIETSLGITAMAHLAGLADWLDLDAPISISDAASSPASSRGSRPPPTRDGRRWRRGSRSA